MKRSIVRRKGELKKLNKNAIVDDDRYVNTGYDIRFHKRMDVLEAKAEITAFVSKRSW